jgi:hypothetical protein
LEIGDRFLGRGDPLRATLEKGKRVASAKKKELRVQQINKSIGSKRRMHYHSLVSLLIIGATWATILLFDYRRVGKLSFEEEPMGLLVHAGLLLLIGALAWATSDDFRHFIFSKGSRLIIAFVGLGIAIGIFRGNAVTLILLDLKIATWIYGGYGLACLLAQTVRPRLLTYSLAASASLLLILAARGAEVIDETGRIGRGVYWDYCDLCFVFIGVVYSYFSPFTLIKVVLMGAILSIYAYYGLNLGANRSDLIAFLVFGIAAVAALMCRPKAAGFGLLRSPRLKFLSILIMMFVGLYVSLQISGDLSVSDFRGIARLESVGIFNETTSSRWDELRGLFSQSSVPQLIVGRGLGGTILNVTGEQQINYLHIAAFEYLMKLGMVPFLAIIWLLYINIPARFIRTLLADRSLTAAETQAILCGYPFVLGWLALTLMSRGINWYFALGLGIIWAVFDSRCRQRF